MALFVESVVEHTIPLRHVVCILLHGIRPIRALADKSGEAGRIEYAEHRLQGSMPKKRRYGIVVA